MVDEIQPHLPADFRAQHPLRIVGYRSHEVLAAELDAHPDVEVVGTVDQLESEHDRARAMVVPLRTGSGVKNKIVEALGAGLPVISSPVGVEGMALKPGLDVEVADSPEEFAAAIVRVVEDREHWERLARAGPAWVAQHASPEDQAKALWSAIEAVTG